MKQALYTVSILAIAVGVHAASRHVADPNLTSAGAPYAPMDASKASDSYAKLSASERDELLSEFKGLVNLGLRAVPYEKWNAKEMADCERPDRNVSVSWTHRCEIITGQGNGYYYFYPNETRQASTLQELDIRLHASDEQLLDDFRRPVQDLFGRASFVDNPTTVKTKAASPIRRWNTNSDVVELFMDRSVRPEGSVRFVWKRSPLVSSSQASLPNQNDDN